MTFFNTAPNKPGRTSTSPHRSFTDQIPDRHINIPYRSFTAANDYLGNSEITKSGNKRISPIPEDRFSTDVPKSGPRKRTFTAYETERQEAYLDNLLSNKADLAGPTRFNIEIKRAIPKVVTKPSATAILNFEKNVADEEEKLKKLELKRIIEGFDDESDIIYRVKETSQVIEKFFQWDEKNSAIENFKLAQSHYEGKESA